MRPLITEISLGVIASACVLAAACGQPGAPSKTVTPTGATAATAPKPASDQKADGAPVPKAADPALPRPVVASASTAGTIRRAAACSYISREEMSELLAAPIGRPSPDEREGVTSCLYPPADAGSYAQAEVTIEWDHGSAPSLAQQMADTFGGSSVGRQVAHDVQLGDRASYSMEGLLTARTGKTLVTISVPMRPGSEEQAFAIGKKLFERLGVPTTPLRQAAAKPAAADSEQPTDDALTVPMASASPKFPDGLSVGEACPAADGVTIDAAASTTLVPLKVGLTLSHVWVGRASDYEHECLVQVVAVTATYVDVTESCPHGTDRHNFTGTRRLCGADLADSFFYYTATQSAVPRVVTPATMFSLSTHSLRELKTTGNTRHRYIDFNENWRTGPETMLEDTDGTLHSGPGNREPYKVIVNDRVVELPTVVGVSNAGTAKETTARVLDDERFPIVLDYEVPGDGFRLRFTKISYPTGGEIEQHLETENRVDVYGIYFDFAKATLRAESEPVLKEIADVMGKHPDWTLSVEGHTDNVGDATSNLDLSTRRSAAVKDALVSRYQIAAARLIPAGFGASRPKEPNDTPEGRARNRRVELVKQ
jgi:outer membrane protein OmpA-like peptidoglycan-associated protein